MPFADNEANIINFFQQVNTKEIALFPNIKEMEMVLTSILNEKCWGKWTDSSGKDALPPDFFCDELGLMMDVMRVDDHGFKRKGKTINPTLKKEHQIEEELRNNGILDMFPSANVFINANSGLPTNEDHNYIFYRDNFVRTVSNHIKKIPNYRLNHPEYKLIFFVFDESSAYIEKIDCCPQSGAAVEGHLHLFFIDRDFVNAFAGADIDYLIWYAPYKRINVVKPYIELPKACVFKNGKSDAFSTIAYDQKRMISSER